ncbi:MAG: hypothetical protein [Arizlama microvirus]|nr:MAG: hypothetical protein [Arizlama microvirus]
MYELRWFARVHWCLWLLFALLCLSGCAVLRDSRDVISMCRADQACAAQMESAGTSTTRVLSTVAAGTDTVVISLISGLVSLFTGLVAGRKLKKRG